jgi:ELWxxDGT repeat protein
VNNALVFRSFDDEHGFELWRSDGSDGGTALLEDIRPGTLSSFPFNITTINGVVFFSANDGVHMTEPWKTDGTEGATALIKDVNSVIFTADSSPTGAVALGRKLVFVAFGGTGSELWQSDGTGRNSRQDIRRVPSHPSQRATVVAEPCSSRPTTASTAASCGRRTGRRRGPQW